MKKNKKKLINESRLYARKLADIAGIHEVSRYRILNGQRKLNNLDTLYKLSKALGVNLNYFFTNSDISEEDSDNENLNVHIFYGNKKEADKKYPATVKIPLMRSKAPPHRPL